MQNKLYDNRKRNFINYDEKLQRGVLKRIKHLLSVYEWQNYVATMVISMLEYASIIWGDKPSKALMDSIQALQNIAAKLILDMTSHFS